MLSLSMKWVRGNGDVAWGETASLGVPVIGTKRALAPLAKWWWLFCLRVRMRLFGGHECSLQTCSLV